jgi:hypothetical protein
VCLAARRKQSSGFRVLWFEDYQDSFTKCYTYPANNVESLVEEARVGRPLSSNQLQQKHSKAIHVWFFSRVAILQVFWCK